MRRLVARALLAPALLAGAAAGLPSGVPSSFLVYNATLSACPAGPSSSSCVTSGFELFGDASGASLSARRCPQVPDFLPPSGTLVFSTLDTAACSSFVGTRNASSVVVQTVASLGAPAPAFGVGALSASTATWTFAPTLLLDPSCSIVYSVVGALASNAASELRLSPSGSCPASDACSASLTQVALEAGRVAYLSQDSASAACPSYFGTLISGTGALSYSGVGTPALAPLPATPAVQPLAASISLSTSAAGQLQLKNGSCNLVYNGSQPGGAAGGPQLLQASYSAASAACLPLPACLQAGFVGSLDAWGNVALFSRSAGCPAWAGVASGSALALSPLNASLFSNATVNASLAGALDAAAGALTLSPSAGCNVSYALSPVAASATNLSVGGLVPLGYESAAAGGAAACAPAACAAAGRGYVCDTSFCAFFSALAAAPAANCSAYYARALAGGGWSVGALGGGAGAGVGPLGPSDPSAILPQAPYWLETAADGCGTYFSYPAVVLPPPPAPPAPPPPPPALPPSPPRPPSPPPPPRPPPPPKPGPPPKPSPPPLPPAPPAGYSPPPPSPPPRPPSPSPSPPSPAPPVPPGTPSPPSPPPLPPVPPSPPPPPPPPFPAPPLPPPPPAPPRPPRPPQPPAPDPANTNHRPLAVMLVVLLAVLLAGTASVSATRMAVAFWYVDRPGTAYEYREEEEEEWDEEEGGFYDAKGNWVSGRELEAYADRRGQEQHIHNTRQTYGYQGRGPLEASPPPRGSRGPMGFAAHEQPGFPPRGRGYW